MTASKAIACERGDVQSELRRAADGIPGVTISGVGSDSVTVEGPEERVALLVRELWTREVSAREYGQHTLAEADRTARTSVQNAV
ncbi:hypothetical protein EGH21_00015 [Halomicroarcula sp. F13]|uniref:Uncharacterized protein n=1 Tax=Haloarcula rubra TaxID=2487747 RepID=A0AAW4PK22_9EURY|nr:hypothetical protein [Halomicroarcula rubra]MBX0321401.1 hypothetical protein [Halomicroarcula rubra]